MQTQYQISLGAILKRKVAPAPPGNEWNYGFGWLCRASLPPEYESISVSLHRQKERLNRSPICSAVGLDDKMAPRWALLARSVSTGTRRRNAFCSPLLFPSRFFLLPHLSFCHLPSRLPQTVFRFLSPSLSSHRRSPLSCVPAHHPFPVFLYLPPSCAVPLGSPNSLNCHPLILRCYAEMPADRRLSLQALDTICLSNKQ